MADFSIPVRAGAGDPVKNLQDQIKELQNQLMNGVEGPDADAIRKEIKDLQLKLATVKSMGSGF